MEITGKGALETCAINGSSGPKILINMGYDEVESETGEAICPKL